MAHISRHELKQDELRSTYEEFEDFVKTNYRQIATVAGIIIVVAGLAVGLREYQNRREAEANVALGAALKSFRGYVGEMPQSSLMPGLVTFSSQQEKYKKAQEQFQEVITKFSSTPEPKAVAVARYHVGLCQSFLGDSAAATKTLEEASPARPPTPREFTRRSRQNRHRQYPNPPPSSPSPTFIARRSRSARARFTSSWKSNTHQTRPLPRP